MLKQHAEVFFGKKEVEGTKFYRKSSPHDNFLIVANIRDSGILLNGTFQLIRIIILRNKIVSKESSGDVLSLGEVGFSIAHRFGEISTLLSDQIFSRKKSLCV